MARNPQLHSKITELKKRSGPISYSNVSVNQLGALEQRSGLLDQRIVEGYGCIWGQPNQHGEIFTKGCFARSIADNGPGSNSNYQIKFRDEHGKACALFAELKEDDIGLYFKTVPLDTVQWCDDLLVQLKSGTINNFSNGFKFMWDKIEWDDETDSIVVLEARLFEISAVAIPSDLETYAMRTLDEPEYLFDDTEDFILSLPRSKQLEARKIFTRYTSFIQSEPLEQRHQRIDTPNNPNATGIDYAAMTAELSQHSLI